MKQSRCLPRWRRGLRPLWALPLLLVGCDRHGTASAPPPAPSAATLRPATTSVITVASLVPAATDLILGMGAGNRLVAISTYDQDRPGVHGLPRVGDYQSADWEALAQLHPGLMIVQVDPGRLPRGFTDRAAEVGARLVDVKIDRLSDLPPALDQIARALGEPQLGSAAAATLQRRLAAVQRQAADLPAVPTLVVVGAEGTSLAGPGTFLDDLLRVAGGRNVAASLHRPWPEVDREMLASLRPAAIIQLMPDATPQELAQAAAVWRSMPQLPAVAGGQVHVVTQWYALLPGWHVPDLAEQFFQMLHGERGAGALPGSGSNGQRGASSGAVQ